MYTGIIPGHYRIYARLYRLPGLDKLTGLKTFLISALVTDDLGESFVGFNDNSTFLDVVGDEQKVNIGALFSFNGDEERSRVSFSKIQSLLTIHELGCTVTLANNSISCSPSEFFRDSISSTTMLASIPRELSLELIRFIT